MTDTIHHLPGRLRVRLRALKHDRAAARRVHAAIEAVDGVTQVRTSTVTGSVLVHYDPATLPSRRLLDSFAEVGFPVPAVAPQSLGERLAEKAFGAALEIVVERSAVALVAALI